MTFEVRRMIGADHPSLPGHFPGAAIVPGVVILDEIVAALARGDRVELRGFGAFSVKHRPARAGRNPRTGAHVPVDQKSVPFFKTGKEMRERLNRDNGTSEAGA